MMDVTGGLRDRAMAQLELNVLGFSTALDRHRSKPVSKEMNGQVEPRLLASTAQDVREVAGHLKALVAAIGADQPTGIVDKALGQPAPNDPRRLWVEANYPRLPGFRLLDGRIAKFDLNFPTLIIQNGLLEKLDVLRL